MRAPKVVINPYLPVPHQPLEVQEELHRQTKAIAKANKEYEKIIKAYQSLVRDQRYIDIHKQVSKTMATHLHALVKAASRCPNCVSIAAPIQLLQNVIQDPIEQVWLEEWREKAVAGERESEA